MLHQASHIHVLTVYPKKYAHGFCFAVLCCGYTVTDLPISIRLTSLTLWQSNDCPSASKATLMNMDTYFMWIHYERLHNHNKAMHNKTVCIFLGIYCTYPQNVRYSDDCVHLDGFHHRPNLVHVPCLSYCSGHDDRDVKNGKSEEWLKTSESLCCDVESKLDSHRCTRNPACARTTLNIVLLTIVVIVVIIDCKGCEHLGGGGTAQISTFTPLNACLLDRGHM